MSIAAILKLDEKKFVQKKMEEFLANGGVVRRVERPTYLNQQIGFLQSLPTSRTRQKMIQDKVDQIKERAIQDGCTT